jgi:anti-sigma-K factor RskA
MMEDLVADLLPGYALGSLDEDELIQVARHLPTCDRCRNELISFWQTADHLAMALPLRSPSPDLRARILSRVEQTQVKTASLPPVQSAVPLRARPSRTERWRVLLNSLFVPRMGMLAAGLALILVLILSVSNFLMWKRVSDIQALVPAGNMRLVNLKGTSNAPVARGYLMVFKNEKYGSLVVEDAPALQAGTQYQLWLIKDGIRTNGGVFSVNAQGYATLEINSSLTLESYQSVGITVEPSGGSPAPTGEKVLGGDL